MARLLSGLPDSEAALAHARELLEAALGRWDRLTRRYESRVIPAATPSRAIR